MTISEIKNEIELAIDKYGDFDIASKEDLKILIPKVHKFIYNIPEKETIPFEGIIKVELWKKLYNL